MIVSYSKKERKINPLPETRFTDHNIMERRDIEAWIEDCPDILGEAFYIITTEYSGFDKTNERPDILAIDRDGTLAVIELKRDSSGKNVDLQAVKYAAYCSTLTFEQVVDINAEYLSRKGIKKSSEEVLGDIIDFMSPEFEELDGMPRIILVAKDYTPEVTATVLWLRKFDMDISCIKLKPYTLDIDTIVFESSVIIPLPEEDDLQMKIGKYPNNKTLNRTQEEYLKFYTKIMKNIKDKISLPFKYRRGDSYCQIETNIARVHFEWIFRKRPKNSFGVEIHFEKRIKLENENLFNEVLKLKDELEKETGETVIHDINWQCKWSRIYIEKKQWNMDEGLIEWSIEKMIIFMNIINKVLDNLNKTTLL